MDAHEIKKYLCSHFTEVQDQCKDVFRATKKSGDQIYQIHYIDLSQHVLAQGFDLENYQRNLLLKDYYSVEGALQWNFYLHFLIDEGTIQAHELENLRHWIEADKKLARKSVFTLSEFKRYLTPIISAQVESPIDVADQWKNLLGPELSTVLDEKISLTSILSTYITSEKHKKAARMSRRNQVKPFPLIKNLDLIGYRLFPQIRAFEFGMVNLVSGPNAVGKTSLLETIELAICGKTMRNPAAMEDFHFKIRPFDEKESISITREDDVEYRSRDHYWYGRNYPRGNELHNSFSRFNFFDADAAVRFSERIDEGGGIGKALTQVIFGPDADRVYERILKIYDLFEAQRKILSKSINEYKEQEKRLQEELNSKIKADPERVSQEFIVNQLRALGIKIAEFELENLEAVTALLGEASVPLSYWRSAIERYNVSNYSSFGPAISSLGKSINDFETTQLMLNQEIEAKERANLEKGILKQEIVLFERLRAYQVSSALDMPDIRLQMKTLSEKIEVYDKAIRSFELVDMNILDRELTLSAAKAFCKETLESIRKACDENTLLLSNLQKHIDKIDLLLKELQCKGREIVAILPNISKCPLCDSVIEAIELKTRLEAEPVNKHNPEDVGNYISIAARLTEEKRTIEERLRCLNLLEQAILQLGLKKLSSAKISDIASHFDKIRNTTSENKATHESLRQKYEKFYQDGFSCDELESIRRQLNLKGDIVKFIEDNLHSHIEATMSQIDQKAEYVGQYEKKIQGHLLSIDKIKASSKALLSSDSKSIYSLSEELHNAYRSVTKLSNVVVLTDIDTLASVESKIAHAKELIGAYLRSVADQKSANSLQHSLIATTQKIHEMTNRQKRCLQACSTLDMVMKTQNPEILLADFLEKHSELISNIFNQIHSPREFVGVAIDNGELFVKRRSNGDNASLNELSTGQRTALVLSVFLSMNRVMENGPRLLIFDDPVAYVDDLNILSFFDYLQRLALEQSRQIFFATANDKIASIFSKKFDFLKESPKGFKNIKLCRIEHCS